MRSLEVTSSVPDFVVNSGGCGWPGHCISFPVMCHERIGSLLSSSAFFKLTSTVIPVPPSWTWPLWRVVGFVDSQNTIKFSCLSITKELDQ